MSNFTGVLLITGDDESFLDTDLLLMAGIPDSAQAAFAATGFLQEKGLGTGDLVVVSGETGDPVGGVSTIVMEDAAAVQGIAGEALASVLEHMTATVEATKPVPKMKAAAVGTKKKTTTKPDSKAKKVQKKKEAAKGQDPD